VTGAPEGTVPPGPERRPDSGRRDRRLVALACAADRGSQGPLREQVRAALDGGELTVGELREAALHIAVYAGWPRASVLDQVVAEEAGRVGAPGWDRAGGGAPARTGAEEFALVNCRLAREPATPLYEAVLDFVFGEVWQRPLLGRRDRRLISLACTALSGAETPVRAHVHGALCSGELTAGDLREVALLVAGHGGRAAADRMLAAMEQLGPRPVTSLVPATDD
jgi:4-carboxymuconolactone decarboxylase